MKKPFHSYCDLDSVTVVCPCTASITGEGEVITQFFKKHKKHTNGECVDTITDDGMRVFSKNSRRRRTFSV